METDWEFPTLKSSLLVLCFLLAYIAAVHSSISLSAWTGSEIFRIENGVLAGALLICAFRWWLLIVPLGLLGWVLAQGIFMDPARVEALLPHVLINTVEPLTAAFLVTLYLRGPIHIARIRHVLAFVLLACLVAPGLGAAVGATAYAGEDPAFWLQSASAGMLGMMAVAPVIAGWAEQGELSFVRSSVRKIAETGFMLLLVAVWSFAVFGISVDVSGLLLFAPYAVLPLLVLTALRLNPAAVATAGLLVAGVALYRVGISGPVFTGAASAPAQMTVSLLNLALVTCIFTSLAVAALNAERRAMRSRADEARAQREIALAYQARLRALAYHASLAEEQTRRRTAVELHDGISQRLAVTNMKLGVMRERLTNSDRIQEIDEIRSIVNETIGKTRSVMYELSPPILYDLGFEPAVRWLAQRLTEEGGIEIEVMDDEQHKPLHSELQVTLFQAVRELLLNIIEHAQAQKAAVSLERHENHIRIRVEDDGNGFGSAATQTEMSTGMGLLGIQERLRFHGGAMEIRSEQGAGTIVILLAPIDLPSEGEAHDDQDRHRR